MANEHLGLYGVPSLFPTPAHIGEIMLSRLPRFSPTDVILEPSAGTGALASIIRAAYPNNPLFVIEKDPWLRLDLFKQGYLVLDHDFFRWREPVDWVVMNPPFSNNYQDINHFCHAWRIARKGVVSLLHQYSGFAKWGKPQAFQNWFLRQNIQREMLEEGSFLESEMPSPVAVCMLWGVK